MLVTPFLFTICLSGCSSIHSYDDAFWDPAPLIKLGPPNDTRVIRPYSGTQLNCLGLYKVPNATPVYILDLPFSFVVDTFALPYTIPTQFMYGHFGPAFDLDARLAQ